MPRLTPFFESCAALNASGSDGVTAAQIAAVLLSACESLDDEALGKLPATPDGAAEGLQAERFAGRAPGVLLPAEWLESFSTALGLPLAEVDDAWDISDGETIYFCPIVELADDPDSPQDKRPYVRLDAIRPAPESES